MTESTDQDQEPKNEIDDPWAEAFAEQASVETDQPVVADDGVKLADLDELAEGSESTSEEGDVDLNMILDIPVTISMEIGRTRISIRNLLKFNQGSVVELDRLAGEPLDVLVNGTLIAHGEVVVVNEKFGIRLTDVITAMERIQKLR